MMIRLIVKNIRSRPVRNGALIISYALIAASLFSGQYLMAGARDSINQEISRFGADMIVVPEEYIAQGEGMLLRGEPSSFFFNSTVAREVEDVSGVAQVAPQIYIATLPADCCSALVQLIAIDPSRDFTITPWLARERQQPLGKDEIIVGNEIIGDIGSVQSFYGHTFVIGGRLDSTGTGVDRTVFLRDEDARIMAAESRTLALEPVVLPEGKASAILVRVENPADTANVALSISARVPGTKAITSQSLIERITGRLATTTRLLDTAALVASLVTLPLIALISVMAAHERLREIGVLRALGATRTKIFGLIIGESVLGAAAGGFAGVAISSVLFVLFQNYIAFRIGVPLSGTSAGSFIPDAAIAVGLTVSIGGISSLFPATRAAIMDPYDAIQSGEQ